MKKPSQLPSRASAILPFATVAVLALLGAATALAQTDTTWTRGGGTNDWNNASNWSAGVPVGGFNAIFGANVGGDPNQFYTLAADKITFASGNSAAHTLQFNIWNVNTAGTFIEVQASNSGAQQINVSRGAAERGITLKAGTSTILNNGSGGLTVGSVTTPSTGSLRSALNANSTLSVDGTGTTTIGPISSGVFSLADNGTGVLSLTKAGSGVLTLSGNNTFSGGFTVGGNGSVNLTHSSAAGTGTIFLNSTQTAALTTLRLSGGITVANAISKNSTTGREGIESTGTGNNALTGGITITGAGANSIFFANNQSSGNLTISGGISGASYGNTISLRGSQAGNVGLLNGAVTLASNAVLDNNGSTSWTLNTAGSTWGQTFVRSTGNLILGANNALATGAFINFDTATSTGAINLNGFNQSVAGLSSATPTTGNGGRIINNGTADSTLTLSGMTGNRTYNGTITDGPSNKTSLIMNSSTRTQTLNGVNTYTGDTTVSGGTLLIGTTGSIANSGTINVASSAILNVSAVTGGFVVGSSQTLRGGGTVVGNTTVNGALQPGSSPGLLSFNNDLTLGSTAATTMEINGASTRGMVYDAINVGGSLAYNGALTLLIGTNFGVGNYDFNLFDSGSTSGTFNTVDLGGFYSGQLSNVGSGSWALTKGNDTWTFTQSTGNLSLNVIPEPSTWSLLAVSLSLAAILRRRRA